jgi:diacylglycerol kinase family enzyme
MKSADSILYLYNPHANEGRARSMWKHAAKKHSFLPQQPYDITRIDIASLIKSKNPRVISIAGGDGTINAVCSVVSKMKKKPQLSIIPMGFGNALSYCLGVETIEKAMDVLKNPTHAITIDMMKTNIAGHAQGVFNISVGFDARIVFHKQDYRYIGIGSYILSALRSIISHSEKEIALTIDHQVTVYAKASSLVVANCPVIGHNYLISSDAKLNDGLLDCSLFSTRYAYLTNLRLQGFKHPLYTELGKVHFKASHIRIEGEPYVQIDGDPAVHTDGIEIELLPKQVTFLRNKKEAINQQYLPFL